MKNLQGQNYAFLSKMAFNLLSQPRQLWVQVLQAKYKWESGNNYEFKTKIVSHVWCNIAKVWQQTELNVAWAGHELVSDHIDECLNWLLKHYNKDSPQLLSAINP